MPAQSDLVYRNRDTIVNELANNLLARIPNANIDVDTVFRILMEVFASSAEGLYLANQLLRDDMFVQTMQRVSLLREGEQYGLAAKQGTFATGTVLFTGTGGQFVPVGTEVGVTQFDDATLVFATTTSGTIPNPGVPAAPTVADQAAGLLTGTYEWAVTFVTTEGETAIGIPSAALLLAGRTARLTAIPIGGPGTISRRIYRMVNGGVWQFVVDLADNVTVTYDDNIADGTLGGSPLSESTAERIRIAIQAEEAGVDYNVGVGTITNIVSGGQGIVDVTNDVVVSGGSDPESTERFRLRLLQWLRNPWSGSADDLVSLAMTVEGVDSATAFKNDNLGVYAPGHVTIRIAGVDGAIPDAGLIAQVQELLDLEEIANMAINVGAFDAVTVSSSVTLTLNPDYSLAEVTPSVQQAIKDYINSVPVGGTVYVAGIMDAVFGLPGVDTLALVTPAADIVLTSTQKAIADTPVVA